MTQAPGRLRLLVTIIFLFTTLLDTVAGDAAFLDVRTHLTNSRSGRGGDPIDKYFHESTFDPHYDGRFATKKVEEHERLSHLTAMMQTFLSTMSDIGAETWIAHGTLMGWWWNQRILPWDSDIDVQVNERTIAFLAKYYNMTEYTYHIPHLQNTRTYLLEVNPHYIYRDQADKLNVIDARWIDTDTGLFIDVSTVRPDTFQRNRGVQGALMCKDRHHYLEKDIFPLRDSYFEGVHVKIPFEYADLLAEEYGEDSLVNTDFENHKFNDVTKIWDPVVGRRGRPPPKVRPGKENLRVPTPARASPKRRTGDWSVKESIKPDNTITAENKNAGSNASADGPAPAVTTLPPDGKHHK